MFSIGKENSVAGKSTKADHKPTNAHQIAAIAPFHFVDAGLLQH